MRFYQNIINNVIKGGNLEECLVNLQSFSEHSYLNSLGQQVRQLLQGPPGTNIGLEPPQSDLIPPQSVAKLLTILKEMLSVASMVESRQNDIAKVMYIILLILYPLLEISSTQNIYIFLDCIMCNRSIVTFRNRISFTFTNC